MPPRNHADPPFPGYIVGSLALIADAYHMLNDVMSLVIALYAIKVRVSLCIFLRFISPQLIRRRTTSCLSVPPQPSIRMDGTERRFSLHLSMGFFSARSAFRFLWRLSSGLSSQQVCRPQKFTHAIHLPLQKLRTPSLWLSLALLALPAILVASSYSTVRIDSGVRRKRMY